MKIWLMIVFLCSLMFILGKARTTRIHSHRSFDTSHFYYTGDCLSNHDECSDK